MYLGFNLKSFYLGSGSSAGLQSRFLMPSFNPSFSYNPVKTSYSPIYSSSMYSPLQTGYTGLSLFSKISLLDELGSKYSKSSQSGKFTFKQEIETKSKPVYQEKDWQATVEQNYGIVCPKKGKDEDPITSPVAQDYGIMLPPDESSNPEISMVVQQDYGIALPKTVSDYSEIMPMSLVNYGIICPSDTYYVNNYHKL